MASLSRVSYEAVTPASAQRYPLSAITTQPMHIQNKQAKLSADLTHPWTATLPRIHHLADINLLQRQTGDHMESRSDLIHDNNSACINVKNQQVVALRHAAASSETPFYNPRRERITAALKHKAMLNQSLGSHKSLPTLSKAKAEAQPLLPCVECSENDNNTAFESLPDSREDVQPLRSQDEQHQTKKKESKHPQDPKAKPGHKVYKFIYKNETAVISVPNKRTYKFKYGNTTHSVSYPTDAASEEPLKRIRAHYKGHVATAYF